MGPQATAEASADHSPSLALQGDDLPPFTVLTNEEDWQRKAEHRPAGTYYVIANSESFADVEEYRTSRGDQVGEIRTSLEESETGHGSIRPNISVDSDTLILGLFEEESRKPALSLNTSAEKQNESSTPESSTSPGILTFANSLEGLRMSPRQVRNDAAKYSEPRLSLHYRTFVRRHIARIHGDVTTDSMHMEDAFEREAASFPPVTRCLPLGLGINH